MKAAVFTKSASRLKIEELEMPQCRTRRLIIVRCAASVTPIEVSRGASVHTRSTIWP